MNSTSGPSASDDRLLCPWDSRRSSKELYVKLFVVHLTTIAAFCHVLSIRREPIISWKLVFYVLVPYNIFAQHGLFLAIVLGGLVWLLLNRYLKRSTGKIEESLWRAPRWLFSRVPTETETKYERVPSSEYQPHLIQEPESKWKRVGRTLITSSFLAQCIGTIILYRRRLSHNAVTYADRRVFELGCTGLITAIYWLADTVDLPPFSLSTPIPGKSGLPFDSPDPAPTLLDKTMVMLRDCQAESLQVLDEESPRINSFYRNGAVCFLILLLQRKIRIFESLRATLKYGEFPYESPSGDGQLEAAILSIGFLITTVTSMLMFCGTPRSKLVRKRELRSKDDCKPWYMWFLCPVGVAVLWFPMTVMLGGLWVFLMTCYEWPKVIGQIIELDHWPTNTSCPLLWSDPAANWIWALA